MNITAAQYIENTDYDPPVTRIVKATIDGVEMYVPMTTGNRHYDEIMRQQSEGLLTIEEAE